MPRFDRKILVIAVIGACLAGLIALRSLISSWPQAGYLDVCDRFEKEVSTGTTADELRTWASNSWHLAKQQAATEPQELEPGALLLRVADVARLHRPTWCRPATGTEEAPVYVMAAWRDSLGGAWWFLHIGATNYTLPPSSDRPRMGNFYARQCAPGIWLSASY